ncbi:hypothetical protein [Solibacillus sp. FSL K6-1554]|uniref:hypothetical protein n=1 Tax=Solibacillus sp. FSL K6-1554 TaxID=2921472 RepID=UPI0030FABEB0
MKTYEIIAQTVLLQQQIFNCSVDQVWEKHIHPRIREVHSLENIRPYLEERKKQSLHPTPSRKNLHNQTLSSFGYTYKFALPLITEETWDNTIDDVGIVAFVQGLPVHRLDMEYNQYAFAASRLLKNETLYATTLEDGQRVFWPSSCDLPYSKTETYSTRQQAAENGYRELSCINT